MTCATRAFRASVHHDTLRRRRIQSHDCESQEGAHVTTSAVQRWRRKKRTFLSGAAAALAFMKMHVHDGKEEKERAANARRRYSSIQSHDEQNPGPRRKGGAMGMKGKLWLP
ncbi:hypothetical protein HPB47_024053 [Ixodes persulcatus]|uniref:Uncharacterized protein n=1 Tax=Ixodes persulcatus TaxID=34615 RepID=A0AC60Q5L1_IXOPE|nr:hypothetical protein HPB47_024053 [Ixodes persulcatus]